MNDQSSKGSSRFRAIPRPDRITVIINPNAGRPYPILRTLNDELSGLEWSVVITQKENDASIAARKAVEDGTVDLVIVYGGDGTIMEVIGELAGTEMPMLVLRGGTGNVIADELSLPTEVADGVRMASADNLKLRSVDLGVIDGTHPFILRCGFGLEARALELTRDEAKASWGKVAYLEGFVKALVDQETIRCRMWIDGETDFIEEEVVALTVANASGIGVGNFRITPDAAIDDNKLDLCLIRKTGIDSAIEFFTPSGSNEDPDEDGFDTSLLVKHRQVESVRFETDPVVEFQVDGDLIGKTPLAISLDPRKVWMAVC